MRAAGGRWPMVREMRSAVSLTSGPHCTFMRSAGVESESAATSAGVVADAGGDAAHAELGFLVVGGPALALDALELALEERQAG